MSCLMNLFRKTDPLIKTFRQSYGMNLLNVPREDVYVGDVFVYDDNTKALSTKGSIIYFLTPKPTIPDLTVDAVMADVRCSVTKNTDFKLGFDLAGGFMEKFGIGTILGGIKSAFESKGAKTIQFSFPNATKDSVDAMQFGQNLIKAKPIPNHPFFSKENRYFLVMAVARASKITIKVQDKSNHTVDIDISAFKKELINSKTNIDKDSDSAILFNGKKKLGFAVELEEMTFDKKLAFKSIKEDEYILPKRSKTKQPGIEDTIICLN